MKTLRLTLIGLFFFSFIHTLTAQLNVVGIEQVASTGALQVIRWDAISGTVLQTVPTNETGILMSSSALDVSTGKYYFRGLGDLLEIGFFPPQSKATSLQFDLGNTEVDMRTGKLYGLSFLPFTGPTGQITGGQLHVTEFSIADSTETLVHVIPRVTGYYADASAFDSNHGTYYFLGIDSLLGECLYKINLSGNPISHTAIPMGVIPNQFYTLEYDNDSNTLLGLGTSFTSTGPIGYFQVLQMDTLTATVTVVEDLVNVQGYQMGSTSYDQANHAMVFIGFNSSFVTSFQAYDVVNDSLYTLILPGTNIQELEADNTQYALARFQNPTRLDELPEVAQLAVWPQPAADWIQFNLPEGASLLELYDVQGRLKYAGSASGDQVSLAGLADGLYLIRVLDRKGSLLAQSRIVKKG